MPTHGHAFRAGIGSGLLPRSTALDRATACDSEGNHIVIRREYLRRAFKQAWQIVFSGLCDCAGNAQNRLRTGENHVRKAEAATAATR